MTLPHTQSVVRLSVEYADSSRVYGPTRCHAVASDADRSPPWRDGPSWSTTAENPPGLRSPALCKSQTACDHLWFVVVSSLAGLSRPLRRFSVYFCIKNNQQTLPFWKQQPLVSVLIPITVRLLFCLPTQNNICTSSLHKRVVSSDWRTSNICSILYLWPLVRTSRRD